MVIEPKFHEFINFESFNYLKTKDVFSLINKNGYLQLEDFYKNPLQVRDHLIRRDFIQIHPTCGYYATQTTSNYEIILLETVAYILGRDLYDVIIDKGATTNKAILGLEDTNLINFIHSDPFMFAGVLYLTPSPPAKSGTLLFENSKDGSRKRNNITEEKALRSSIPLGIVNKSEESSYVVWQEIENHFNSLVLYDAKLFHAAASFFGSNVLEGRLTQNIFFNISKSHRN